MYSVVATWNIMSNSSIHNQLTAVPKQPTVMHEVSKPRKNTHTRDIKFSAMLHLIGLGLSDETDITVKGLEIVKHAARVYLEAYTSILLVDKSVLVRRSSRSGTKLEYY